MADLQSIFLLEWYLESNFQTILTPACPDKTYRARDPRTANEDGTPATPRIEVIVALAGLQGGGAHSKVTQSGVIYDSYEGELTVNIVTNRTVSEADTPIPTHYKLLAGVRSILTPLRMRNRNTLIPGWNPEQVQLVDLRERASQNTFDAENFIDTTEIKWLLITQINDSAWPANL